MDNKGASTTLVKNNIASFMEAVDIMKGSSMHTSLASMSRARTCSDIRRLVADDRKKNFYEPVIKLTEGSLSTDVLSSHVR